MDLAEIVQCLVIYVFRVRECKLLAHFVSCMVHTVLYLTQGFNLGRKNHDHDHNELSLYVDFFGSCSLAFISSCVHLQKRFSFAPEPHWGLCPQISPNISNFPTPAGKISQKERFVHNSIIIDRYIDKLTV